MAETPRVLSVTFHHVADHDLSQEGLADLFETVVPQIAGEIGAHRQHGRVPMDRGGYCEWRVDYNRAAPQ